MVSQSMEMMTVDDGYTEKKSKCTACNVLGVIVILGLIAVAATFIILYFQIKNESNDAEVATTVLPATTVQPPAVNYRLSDDLQPVSYELILTPDIYQDNVTDFKFRGDVKIKLKCINPTKIIRLHIRDLTIEDVRISIVKEESLTSIVLDSQSEDKVPEFLILTVVSDLKVNETYTIDIQYTGPIKTDLKGIYYSSYKVAGENETRYILTSQLQPTDARKVLPCLDEPKFKASVKVFIDRMETYKGRNFTAWSNGELENTTKMAGPGQPTLPPGWVRDEFSNTPHMSMYLLAFMVTDFGCVDSATTETDLFPSTKVQICTSLDKIDQTARANGVAADIQRFFEEYHNISYPLPHMIHVGVPDFAAGAMENWGLIIYRDVYILYDKKLTTSSTEQYLVKVIAHEYAHQWFGNLVTTEWWDDIWLNEGFASYMETKGTDHVESEWNMEDDMVYSKVQAVMVQDSLATSHPVLQSAQSPEDIVALFDSITYSKGAAIIRMMEYMLPDEPDIFRWALSKYLVDRSYKTASNAQLFDFFNQELMDQGFGDWKFKETMNTWIKQMGYPVVHFSHNKTENTIDVEQKHFLIDPASKDTLPESEFDYVWQVPISFVTSLDILIWSGPTEKDSWDEYDHYNKTILKEKTGSYAVREGDVQWILGNVKERFYYRVNYDPENWDALSTQLMTEHNLIDIKNRAQLLDDSFNLGRAGELAQTRFLDMSKYLAKEEQFLPWRSAITAFNYLDLILGDTGDYGTFITYMKSALTGQMERLGWEETDDSPHLEKRMRAAIISQACSYEIQDCLDNSTVLFNRWLIEEINPIVPNLRYNVYCSGIAAGDHDDWEAALEKYKSSEGDETSTIRSALGCTRIQWLLRRYLEMALDEDLIRRQDFGSVFGAVAGNTIGRILAWEFLVDRWEIICERFCSSMSFYRVIADATRGFSTDYHKKLVEGFVASKPEISDTVRASFASSLETIQSNIDWKKNHLKEVVAWLNANVST